MVEAIKIGLMLGLSIGFSLLFYKIFNSITSEINIISLQLEKIYSRIDEHAKMTEEAHKMDIEEKRRSGRL